MSNTEKVVAVERREGKYQEKPTPYEKYIKRDCQKQPHLLKLCYAQFVKKYYAVCKIDDDYDFSAQKVEIECDKFGKVMFENHIISVDYDESEQATELPLFICIQGLKPGELPYMRRRSVQVLRYHKFNREQSPHEFMYSELQLYMPHSSKKKFGPTLEKERDDFETCLSTYQKSDISKVKGKVMEFLESVEEGLEKAKELQNTIGDELDPQNEQDMDECQAEGVVYHPDFVPSDPQNLPTQSETTT